MSEAHVELPIGFEVRLRSGATRRRSPSADDRAGAHAIRQTRATGRWFTFPQATQQPYLEYLY